MNIFKNSTKLGFKISSNLILILLLTYGQSNLFLKNLKQKSSRLGLKIIANTLINDADSIFIKYYAFEKGLITQKMYDDINLANTMTGY